jgi:6-phosphogluconolactonase (cycloisomerase 2 family)
MKLRKLGQVVLAAVVGLGCSFGITSCVQSHTVGYFYVTGHQYNQIGIYKITNNTGNLTKVTGFVGSGGVNPVDAVVAQSGKFLYVLNAGCADPTVYPTAKYQCASGETPTRSNIELFTIGGDGVLTAQQSKQSIGNNSVAISLDSSGSYLYVLDQNTPSGPGSNTPSQYANDGDVTVFSIDPNTGLLSIQLNLQLQGTNQQQLQFFPVGVEPVWFRVFSSYLYTIDRNDGALPNPTYVNVYSTTGTGQLLVTQNAEIPTGATNLVYAYSGGSYFYLLDAGDPTNSASSLFNGSIYIYQSGTAGNLTPIIGGSETQGSLGYTEAVNPDVMTVDSTSQFVYVANYGPNTGLTASASNVSAYLINKTSGQLQDVYGAGNSGTNTFGSGSGPRCVLEDPSNQYLFTANYNDSSISGYIINTENGTLTNQRGNGFISNTTTSTLVPGNPTWCVASGNVF